MEEGMRKVPISRPWCTSGESALARKQSLHLGSNRCRSCGTNGHTEEATRPGR